MKAVINKNKYKFRKYSSSLPILFQREKSKLAKILPKNTPIEHVGSTSVPRLGGKNIIDIAIFTPRNKLKTYTAGLSKIGFKETTKHPADNRRIFMQRVITEKGKERRVHIHLTLTRAFLRSFILFRDYLRMHPAARDKYARIKKEAARLAQGDSKKYWDYKNSFLEKTTEKALVWGQK
jgi:GrpB-like predicted nucleotidyltransferase (UPF0157 family)